ncbi:MAG TPA: site-2 protease family protein [Acidimicrobiales bacterium]|nr:site-2 protease family protein [Acidimicrobiales bacterium]
MTRRREDDLFGGPSAEGGPAPGLLATADRLGRALAGGTGLNEPVPGAPLSPRQEHRNLLNLGVVVVLLVVLAIVLHGVNTLLVVLALISFVMLHEFGHLITAKWTGMKVSEYFVGFGPRLWSIRRGETEYGVKAIPAGGYVRIVGMNNLDTIDPADEPRSYRQQTFPRRLLVALAGSTMHFLIALVLLFALNTVVGVTNPNKPLLKVSQLDALSAAAPGTASTGGKAPKTQPSPAQLAGFKPGDVIRGADGRSFTSFDDLKSYIESKLGVAIFFDVQRGSQRLTLIGVPANLQTVTPVDSTGVVAPPSKPPSASTGFMGIEPALAKDYANPVTAAGRSFVQFGREVRLDIRALASILSPHGISSIGQQVFSNANSSSANPSANSVRPVSAIGIVHVTNQAAKLGIEPLLTVLVAINVIIGVFNLIPLPPFDGGLVAVAVYERIRSRRGLRYHVDTQRLLPVAYGVFLLLMFIFVSSLYLDITRPL